MSRKLEIYKCPVCDTVVEVLEQCGLELLCCGRPMEQQEEQCHEAGRETHSPIVQRVEGGVRVSVGPIPHVMKSQHHIEWIEILAEGECHRQFLHPGQPPEAFFNVQSEIVQVRVYCTVHGLWRSKSFIELPDFQAQAV